VIEMLTPNRQARADAFRAETLARIAAAAAKAHENAARHPRTTTTG
jgi:hypothetical protein